jgi:tRNA(fMet)-specific endonuclease VapC
LILLDTSVLIDLFRKENKENTLFYKLAKEESDFCISAVTYYEIGIGNKKSHWDYWNRLVENLDVLSFDKNCSLKAIELYSDLKNRNKLIDIADLMIGSTAIANDLPLATLNKKHFERIVGLQLIP